MNRNILILISAACIILAVLSSVQASSAQAATLSSAADQKIDSRLEELLAAKEYGRTPGEKIPVIVMLNADAPYNSDSLISDDLISNDLSVKYDFN